ncbi:MAG: hypothetical protein Q9184_004781 [Pyrenodesmia sp. 2 TL-2023]
MPASRVADIAENATKAPVPIAESSSRALEVIQTSSPSMEQDAVVPVQGAGDEGSSTDAGPLAPAPTSTDPTSATLITSAQSDSASENLAGKGSQSSATPHPPNSDSHASPSSSIPIATGTSSQAQPEMLSNTDVHTPQSTNIGSVAPGSGGGVGNGDGSDPAAQPTELKEQTSSSGLMGHTDSDSQSTPSVVGDMETSASATDFPNLPPPTKEPQGDSISKSTSSILPTEPPPPDEPSLVGPQLWIPTPGTESASTGLLSTVAEAPADAPADPSATSVVVGKNTPNSLLPEVPAPSPNAAILPQPTLESSSEPSGAIVDVPTATWTTIPQNLKEVVVTNTAWTRDTLITTTSPGSDQPTVVPVFANCEGCGPGGSLIVFGVSIPLISYHLPTIPGFPPIPRFHLPCVLFCPSSRGPPPGSSSGQDNDTPPQPGPPEREEENGDDDDDNSEDNQDDKNNEQDDEKDDDQDNDQDNDQDEDDQDEDDQDEDDQDKDDQDEDNDDQQSTTSQSSSVISTSSSVSSSSETSSTTRTESAVVTETAYINERPTGDLAPGANADAKQYLLAAYSSLEIADGQFDSASSPTATAPTALPITSLDDLVTAGALVPSSTNAASTTLSCASLADASDSAMEKSDFLGPTSVDPYGPRQRAGYIAEACGPLADDTAPLSGGPFADDHSFSIIEPTQTPQSMQAHFVVTNNASACDKTEPTVGDCKKWFGSILDTCGDNDNAAGGSLTDANCTIYNLSIEGAD